jgi:hypoxanthine phosphoribosyltransferase
VFVTETERAFSELLTALGLDWEYEPREFAFPAESCAFRPDFYIPVLDLYVELTTQKIVTKKNRKMRLMTEHYPEVKIVLLGRKQLALFTACAA